MLRAELRARAEGGAFLRSGPGDLRLCFFAAEPTVGLHVGNEVL